MDNTIHIYTIYNIIKGVNIISKYYAGIGSRNTPNDVMDYMKIIGKLLAERGYILRSGGALGADSAFEEGCNMSNGLKEIYIPWGKPNNNEISGVDSKALELARIYHPRFNNISIGSKRLIARNGYQVLGRDLMTLSEFVVCYTKGGKEIGGTAQSIKIALDNNIPVFNAGSYDSLENMLNDIIRFIDG